MVELLASNQPTRVRSPSSAPCVREGNLVNLARLERVACEFESRRTHHAAIVIVVARILGTDLVEVRFLLAAPLTN